MPLPKDKVKTKEILLQWTLGDESAANFLLLIGEIARLADDIVDEESNRQTNTAVMLSKCLTILPLNPFFARYAVVLGPILNEALVSWEISDEWRGSGDSRKQTFGFVIRESTDKIATAVAAIVGGYEHAKEVARDVFEVCHGGSDETVEMWVEE